MRRVVLIGLLGAAAFGCGDDNNGSKTNADAGVSDGGLDASTTIVAHPDGAVSTAADGAIVGTASDGAVSGSFDSGSAKTDGGAYNMCPSSSPSDYGGCTPNEVMSFQQCVQTACKSSYETCYGVDYMKGSFSGPCADYVSCESKCACDDTACAAACTRTQECSTCQQTFASCASSCIGQLSCATRGLDDAGVIVPDAGFVFPDAGGLLADSGINLSKTCADLLTCCDQLTDTNQKTACTQLHTTLSSMPNANLQCSGVIAGFCP